MLGTMSGYRGYRGLRRFRLRHQGHLAERLGLRRGTLPSYSTIRRLLMEIDFDAVAETFNLWAQAAGLVPVGSDCAVDGKGLKKHRHRVFALPDSLKQLWSGAQQGVEVISTDTRRRQPYRESHSYITSWTDKADALQARIRAH